MSNDPKDPKDAPEQINDEQLDDVAGAGKFNMLRSGVNAETITAINDAETITALNQSQLRSFTKQNTASGLTNTIKGADRLKR